MRFSRRLTRRLPSFAVAVTLAVGLAATGATPAAAECDGSVPSFREHASSARRIVIGDVIAVDPRAPWTDDEGRSSRFTLRVRYVLRGRADPVMTIRDLAFLPCSDHVITARKGDRIALALDATGFRPRITFNIAAWVGGTPPGWPGYERITVRAAFSLVGKAVPDTATAPARTEPPFPIGRLAILLAGLVAGAIAWRRQGATRAGERIARPVGGSRPPSDTTRQSPGRPDG